MKGPLILLSVIAGVAVLAVVMAGPGPGEDPNSAAAAADEVRARYAKLGRTEGKDFTIETPVVVSKADDAMLVRLNVRGFEDRAWYFELKRDGRAWKVAADLDKSFDDFLKSEDAKIRDRLGKQLVDRFRAEVQYRVESARIRLVDREGDVFGTTDWIYMEKGGRGRYLEEFRYENGAWTSMGAGQLFDMPGGPRR